ncbi:methylmalonyl-CoA epimerase [Peribacillus tepidiphilus]|uniref:methylmalonyl-CoA epimerase n=1 Tax=Peribacillus tepidiphilus TaxID=2652445 RepID=UPI0035B55ECD
MITKIDHIGIAVRSLDDSLKFYLETLDLTYEGTETVENQGVRVAFLLAGNTRLELLEAISEESPIAKFIKKRGEGIHHVALGVKNIEERIKEIKDKGIVMIHDEPKRGAHGAKVAFLHPKSTGGVLYEFCEREDEKGAHS